MLLTRPKRRFPLWIFTRNFLLRRRRTPTRSALIFAGSRTDYQTLERQAAQVAAALENALDGQKREKSLLWPPSSAPHAAAVRGNAGGNARRRALPAAVLRSARRPHSGKSLSQSGAQAVLSTPQILARLGVDPAPIACVDMENLPESQAPARAVPPDALAYVVYTSGSTGVPKGGGDQPLEPFEPVAGHAGSIRRRRGAFGVQRGV